MKHDYEFYPKIVNSTNVVFANTQMTLLNKGLQYNVHYIRT
jgi:hypothetical protein